MGIYVILSRDHGRYSLALIDPGCVTWDRSVALVTVELQVKARCKAWLKVQIIIQEHPRYSFRSLLRDELVLLHVNKLFHISPSLSEQ